MSGTQSAPALGSRENFWGDDEPTDERGTGHPQDRPKGTSKVSWLAHRLLKEWGDPRLLSGPALVEEDVEDELTDPCVYVPLTTSGPFREVDYGVNPTQKRYGETYGYIGGVEIADRPREEFLDLVDAVLQHCQVAHDLREKHTDPIRSHAGRLKADDQHSDVEALEIVLSQLQERI